MNRLKAKYENEAIASTGPKISLGSVKRVSRYSK